MADALGREEVQRALAEDRAAEDVTTRLLGAAARRPACAAFVAEGRFVVAGLPIVARVYSELERDACFEPDGAEGEWVAAGTVLARVRATAGALLAGERVALNFLQRLSGIATLTRRAVDAVAGTQARITHTRKTTPGLRALERYAVTVGGGVANRGSLAEAVLWKDNHWALLGAGGLAPALASAPPGVPIMVEVEDEAQLEQALAAGVRHILADNQGPERVAAWVRRVGPCVTIQASGGITPESARAYGEAGAALISIGALTHSAPAAPIRCDIRLAPTRGHGP
ncbi:MAG: nicotinate-nucleotide diphosphorylase (carboxylating) [Gemmatimonadetes bacterium 13_1_40CM_4_69_8]|nr:MAG: nicotinate-nucleotide diphosphorylase (carboxylating) [Gemmatimonadetes bacterium 13_1_40CM_4_69_8]